VYPSTILNGQFERFRFQPGVKVCARVRMLVTGNGEISLEEGVWLAHDVEMETLSRISIGAGTTVQRRAAINGTVSIGEGCIIAPNVFVSSGTHPFRQFPDKPIREQERMIIERHGSLASLDRPIIIGDDCWLGVNVVICPGVTIGNACVIGANSVVVTDISSDLVVAGVPVRTISKKGQLNKSDD
jgi:acetyltransferase-like isoleucine patch superfamily enzyme